MMIQTIMAFFGYVRVPKEAVQLSILTEDCILELIRRVEVIDKKGNFLVLLKEMHKKVTRTLTSFLQSGRMLG